MSESQKGRRKKVAGVVRKHLREIEKRLVEGETRDIILDWMCVETGQEIPKTTFIKALYRARQWAQKEQMKVARIAAVPVSSPVVATPQSTQKRPKKEKKPELQVTEAEPDYLALLKAYEATEKKSDPIETIKRLRAEGKIK